MANRLQVFRGVDVAPRARVSAFDRGAALQQLPRAVVAAQAADAAQLAGPSTTGCPGRPPYTARVPRGSPTNRAISAGVTSGWSPSVTITRLRPRAVRCVDAAAQRRRLALAPALAHHRLGAPEVDPLQDLVGARAEHDHDPLELRDRALRGTACSSSGRPSSSASSLDSLAEPRPGARGQDQTRRSSRHLVDPALALGQPAAVAAVAGGDDLGQDRERGLLAADRAEVEAERRRQPLELLVGDARPPAAARAALACARREPIAPTNRAGERSAISSAASSSLGSWVSTAIEVAGSIPPSRANASSGHAAITSLGVREPLRRREPRARVDHVRPPAGDARERAQRGRDVDRAEQDQPRRRRDHVDEQRTRGARSVSAHSSSSAIRAASSSSSGAPSVPERAPSASTSSLAPGTAPSSSVTSAARPPAAGDLLEPAGLVRLHPHVDLAAARQPDVPGVGVGDPEVQQLRRIAAAGPVGDLDHRALDAAAGHRAGDLAAASLTAIFAPGGRGAERWTSITVASAIRSPRSVQVVEFGQDVLHGSDLLQDDS